MGYFLLAMFAPVVIGLLLLIWGERVRRTCHQCGKRSMHVLRTKRVVNRAHLLVEVKDESGHGTDWRTKLHVFYEATYQCRPCGHEYATKWVTTP